MSEYIIGGWTQTLGAVPPETFSYTMYGMVTNFPDLTTGTAASPGWSPKTTPPPPIPAGEVLWTYGGAGGYPSGTPATQEEIDAIVAATNGQGWGGVDFDNESTMNAENIATTAETLKAHAKSASYTFLAGWNYNNQPEGGSADVALLAQRGAIDRFVLMCYGDAMWGMQDIEANVGPAINKTIALGAPRKSVILALTYNGLTDQNLEYFLGQVTGNEIGGLFIWEFPQLRPEYLAAIQNKLGIS